MLGRGTSGRTYAGGHDRDVRPRPHRRAGGPARPAGSTPPRCSARTRLDRAHVFHSWSAQGALTPMVVTQARGRLGVGRRGPAAARPQQPGW
nr:hypothetical protein [Angustibacter aerolatus]